MIETLKKFKYLIIIVIIIVVAFIAYTIYTNGKPATDSASLQRTTATGSNSTVVPSSNSSVPDNDLANSFVDQLLTIKNINLKVSFFVDPVFVALKDNHIDIQSQPISRPNPFAPIGKDAGAESGRYQFIDGSVGGSVPAGVFDTDNTNDGTATSSTKTSTKTKKATTTKAQ
jgi:hypothetical protein